MSAAEAPHLRSLLSNRSYLCLIGGLAVSRLGDQIHAFILTLVAFELTHSPARVGIIGFLVAAPRLGLAGVGGVFADRFDRWRYYRTLQLAALGTSVAFLLLLATRSLGFFAIAVLTVLSGSVEALSGPVRSAMLPQVVSREHVPIAVRTYAVALSIVNTAGVAIAAWLLRNGGYIACEAVNVASFVGAILLIMATRHHRVSVSWRAPFIKSFIAGIRHVGRKPLLLQPLLLCYVFAVCFLGFEPLLPTISARLSPTDSVHVYSMLQFCWTGGQLVGLVWVLVVPSLSPELRTAVLLGTLGFTGLSFAPVAWLAGGMLGIAGAGFVMFRTRATITVHWHVDERYRGLVFGVLQFDYALHSVSMLWLGICAERFGAENTIALAGLCATVLIGAVVWSVRAPTPKLGVSNARSARTQSTVIDRP
jgi:hypothetical protein